MKNVLFISPSFFDYYIEIKNKIEETYSCNVYWFEDRPSQNFLSKAIIRINKKLLFLKNNKYFKKIKKFAVEKNIDTVFVIFGQFLSKKYVLELKKALPNAKFIYYVWDSLKNYKVIKEIYDLFDERFSFDPDDCKEYNFRFLPLFYEKNEIATSNIKYDAVSIFTVKPGKLSNYEMVLEKLPKNINMFSFLYIQSKLVYIFYKLFHRKEFKKYKMKDFKYKKMSKDEFYEYIRQSKCVIDCQMTNQKGLTMRTFEALGFHKKLITSNDNICDYDFYNSNNIIVCTKDEKVPIDFIESEFDYSHSIGDEFSLDSFVKKIFEK